MKALENINLCIDNGNPQKYLGEIAKENVRIIRNYVMTRIKWSGALARNI